MMDMDVAYLRRLAAAAAAALGEDGVRLAAGIEDLLAGRVRTLDQGLKLTRQGGISPAVRARNNRRDALLRAYAKAFLAELSPARQAQAMSREIGEFRTRAWPRLRDLDAYPAHIAGERQRALFELFKVCRVPGSEKQLGRILADRDIQKARLNVQTHAA